MKRIVANIFICCICLFVASCSKEATIGGTASKAQSFGLYTFEKGEIALLQEMPVEDGVFGCTVALPYEGLYMMGPNSKALYPVWLKGGEQISLEYAGNSLKLGEGSASRGNSLLFRWENSVEAARIISYMNKFLPGANSAPYEVFFGKLEEAAGEQKLIMEEIAGEKGEFFDFLRNKMEADLDFYALNYLRNDGYSIPQTEQLPQYYQQIAQHGIFQQSDLLDIPYAGAMLDTYLWYITKDNADAASYGKYYEELLPDSQLQQEYLVHAVQSMKSYDEYIELEKEVGEAFFSERNAARVEKTLSTLLWSKPGEAAPEFKAMAPDSSWISLSDFKGKVVVVDVWATWCEPCRRLMPLFHDLQEEFKGNDRIAFLSVCVGVWIESDQWLKMSKEFGITKNNGFVSGWKSEFVKDYHITGVPRYMVIDREGKIVSLVAPNPANPKLKELILKTLG